MEGHFLAENQMIQGTGKNVLDYWKWAYSTVLNNRERGIFSEFLVGSALDVLNKPRVEWDNADLQYHNYNLEVKSSAFIQSWEQSKISTPAFDIAPKYAWTGIGNEYEQEKRRFADYYIFCLLHEKNREKINPLSMDQWEFYILPTGVLDQLKKTQKKISLRPLQRLCSAVAYHEIKPSLDQLIEFLER
ncbi:hypothetical protein [Virgibacillus oceani]|uniref:Restriction endonuclease n=1 Tax=Virgibacillus oceani TaxID=1479511 RepID=A0A917M5J2_9BACI|nr:hypothetical protein [Virgibacillus oceani]GGG78525.1 hypothetical protein GCM10011398_24750 [Virgibacillus oceani]